MNDPNIEVILTGPHELHCFKLVFQAKPETPEGIERYPLEIFLHTTQAIDLFSKLAAQLSNYFHQASDELIRIKTGRKP
jgi:hypothetical protein